jgi:hypothetical protein
MAEIFLIEEILDDQPKKVDKTKNMIPRIKMLGEVSVNGRVYLYEERQKALSLFQKFNKCNVGHQSDRNPRTAWAAPTDFPRRLGEWRNIVNEKDGIYGDLYCLTSHSEFPKIAESAEFMPSLYGASPVMRGEVIGKDKEGREIISIKGVKCTDLVADPGTNRSLFEESQSGGDGTEETDLDPEAEIDGAWAHLVATHMKHGRDHHVPHILRAKKKLKGMADSTEESSEDCDEQNRSGPDSGQALTTEEKKQFNLLQQEKACRLLCEEAHCDPEQELLDILVSLPTKEAREAHLNFLRKRNLLKKSIKQAPSNGSKPDYVAILRGKK